MEIIYFEWLDWTILINGRVIVWYFDENCVKSHII